jgi:hypothetical protein
MICTCEGCECRCIVRGRYRAGLGTWYCGVKSDMRSRNHLGLVFLSGKRKSIMGQANGNTSMNVVGVRSFAL